MPFAPTYRDYTEGDFIFGLNEGIASFQSYIVSNVNPGINFKADFSQPVTTVRQLWTDKAKVQSQLLNERQALNLGYLDSLDHHPKYINAFNDTITDYATPSVKSNAQFRAKSKAGLNWCITSGKHLHFILDDLGLPEVLSKTWQHPTKPHSPNNEFKDAPHDKIRTVTGSELRWIYRNKNNVETQTYVQFWLNNHQCCPPWDQNYNMLVPTAPNPQAWLNYKNI